MRANATPTKKNKENPTRQRLKEMLEIMARHGVVKGLTPEKLRLILEDLGPTYVKLGQIMSMRTDILPERYCLELTKLRADVRAFPFEQVKAVIEKQYEKPVEEIFSFLDEKPLGSASIAQVHRATLLDGTDVVIKVQRPGIRETMSRDIRLMQKAVGLLHFVSGPAGDVIDLKAVLGEMWNVAQQEMDFLVEADHIREFAKCNADIAYIGWPQVVWKLTTPQLLVMEYIEGYSLDDGKALEQHGYDMEEIGIKLAQNYVKQILDDAFFHADPHPGNIRVRGGKIVWLDLGMMGRLSPRDQALFRRAVKAIVTSDVYELKTILLTLGSHNGRINHTRLYTDIDDMLTKYGSMELGSMDLGKVVTELTTLAADHNISMPAEITMLGRGVVTIEGVLSRACPQVNFIQIMANHLSGNLAEEFDLKREVRHAGRSFLATSRKSLDIPAQISDALKMAIKGQGKLNLEITGSEEPLGQLDKMVNKIVVGIITAALLIGSSLICTTQMQPQILGIPFLGILGYCASMVMLIWLFVKFIHKKH